MDNLESYAPVRLSQACYENLKAAYSQPPRAYHSWGHIIEVAQHWHDVSKRLTWQQPKEVFLAVLYHDVIYVAGRSDNEERSAQWARSELVDVQEVDLNAVERLIRLTAAHGKLASTNVDRDTGLFLDCDMAILGSAPKRYARYEHDIGCEYAHIPKAMFNAGRRQFLEKLLLAPRIFLSDDFHGRFDAQARENLKSALAEFI